MRPPQGRRSRASFAYAEATHDIWRFGPDTDTSETTLRSTLRLAVTLAAAQATFGVFWLAANSVPVRTAEPITLRMPHSVIPGQQITVSGNNYAQCLYYPVPGAYPSASGDLGYYPSDGPDYAPSGSSTPPGPQPKGQVRAVLDGTAIGDPVTPASSGHISITFRLPRDLVPGRHVLATQCERSDGTPVGPLITKVPFRIPWPSLQPVPAAAPPGGTVSVTGQGFWLCRYRPGAAPPAQAIVRLLWQGRLIARARGVRFRSTVTVPRVPPGRYPVAAECADRPPGVRPGPVAHAELWVHVQVHPGGGGHRGAGHHGHGASGPSGGHPHHQGHAQTPPGDQYQPRSGTQGHQPSMPTSTARPASPRPHSTAGSGGPGPVTHVSRLPLHLLAWTVGGSAAGLILLLILAFWTPLGRSITALCSRKKGRSAGRMAPAARPGVAFRGRDDSVPTLPLHHGRGAGSLTIGIRARPDSGGWEVSREALAHDC